MDARTWPLSAAATQLLLDSRADRRPTTTDSLIAQLAAKELLLRGGLRIDGVQRTRRGPDQLTVSAQPVSGTLPGPVGRLWPKLQQARERKLQPLMKEVFRKNRELPKTLRTAAESELLSRGLVEQSSRRVLGLFPSRFLGLTATGTIWQQRAEATIDRGTELAGQETPTPAEIDSLGPLLVLVPGGLSLGARTAAAIRRDPTRRTDPATGSDGSSYTPTNAAFVGGATGYVIGADAAAAAGAPTEQEERRSDGPGFVGDTGSDTDTDGGGDGDLFSPLDGLGDALGGFLDDAFSGIDSAVDSIGGALDSAVDSIGDSIDSAMDSIDSAMGSIDSAIDSGVSDGGGFGGDGGGGGGDGGGGA